MPAAATGSPSTRFAWAAACLSKIGIDWPTYKAILKDTVAPTIGLAANQALPWSSTFGTLGFLIPVVSIITRPSPPRAEFLRIWITSVVGSCASAAVTAIALLCVIKAREQSEGLTIDPERVPYNAIASTVAAIWLVVQTYAASAIRYNYPSTLWMTSACLIFSNYGMVYAVQFPDMTAAFRFLRQLYAAHMVAFAISAGVALLVFPSNSREVFFKTVSCCFRELRLALQTNIDLIGHPATSNHSLTPKQLNVARKQHEAELNSLQSKLVTQVRDAQHEIAWGILSKTELSTLTQHLEELIIPLMGLCQIPEIIERSSLGNDGNVDDEKHGYKQYRSVLSPVIGEFSRAAATAVAGLQCSETTLRAKTPHATTDDSRPDRDACIAQLQHHMGLLVESKAQLLHAWQNQNGSPKSRSPTDLPPGQGIPPEHDDQIHGSLYMVLYTELLLWSVCNRTKQLLIWTRDLEVSRPLASRRLIIPQWMSPKSLVIMFRQSFEAFKGDQSHEANILQRPLKRHKVPSKTPVVLIPGLFQKCAQFFASPASGFALRVTCATMSIAIVAFLPSTQNFYIKQHLVWAQYAVSFAMQGSTGQGVRHLFYRMGGTIIAVCLAWISWYIVLGSPAGVLVFYWISLHFPMYILARKPRYFTVGTVGAFALTTVLGNALQPNGSGQAPITLGAVRLAALAGGCLLAAIWTLFPFPASDRDGARRSLGLSLASLAEYHTAFQEIVRIRLMGDMSQSSANRRSRELEDLHSQLLVKCKSHQQNLRAQLRVVKWNILTDATTFSGVHYECACQRIDDLTRNMQLITFSSSMYLDFIETQSLTSADRSLHWHNDLGSLIKAYQRDGLSVAALLGLLAHSIRNETSLPLGLVPPNPEKLSRYFGQPERAARQVERIDAPGAATFALMRIGTKGLYHDLEGLFRVVRDMVGEFEGVCRIAVDEEA